MSLLDNQSLGRTVDGIDAADFDGTAIPQAARAELARFIASRQGVPGSYRGLFAPTESDFAQGLTLFTGEKITSKASTAHILGQEAYRALLLLDVHTKAVETALAQAPGGMGAELHGPGLNKRGAGVYCCGRCSVAVWRCLLAGGYGGDARFIGDGLQTLRAQRDGRGHWGIFPFWYTLLALVEMDTAPALNELRYAAPLLGRSVKRPAGADSYSVRRRKLAERALAKC